MYVDSDKLRKAINFDLLKDYSSNDTSIPSPKKSKTHDKEYHQITVMEKMAELQEVCGAVFDFGDLGGNRTCDARFRKTTLL